MRVHTKSARRGRPGTMPLSQAAALARFIPTVVLARMDGSYRITPYCGNDLENKPVSAKGMILPEGCSLQNHPPAGVDAFNRWIAGRWFAPSDLKQLMNLGRMSASTSLLDVRFDDAHAPHRPAGQLPGS
jgi:hypothetical protein